MNLLVMSYRIRSTGKVIQRSGGLKTLVVSIVVSVIIMKVNCLLNESEKILYFLVHNWSGKDYLQCMYEGSHYGVSLKLCLLTPLVWAASAMAACILICLPNPCQLFSCASSTVYGTHFNSSNLIELYIHKTACTCLQSNGTSSP